MGTRGGGGETGGRKQLMEGPEWKRKEGPFCPRGGVGLTPPGDDERGENPWVLRSVSAADLVRRVSPLSMTMTESAGQGPSEGCSCQRAAGCGTPFFLLPRPIRSVRPSAG